MTQLPFTGGFAYDSCSVDLETGPRFSFPRRGNLTLPADYSAKALSKWMLNYPMVTDAEVASLYSFFQSQKGRYGQFVFMDPGGNLIQYSEDFAQSYWNKNAVTVGAAVTDPFGGNLATALTATSSNSYIKAQFGPPNGGLLNYMVNASAWVRATSSNQTICIGLLDSTSTSYFVNTYKLPLNAWVRISCNVQLWTNYFFQFILGGENTWASTTIDVFGAQVVPMKGEGAYVRTSGGNSPGYALHPACRFDQDAFQRQSNGPNQNSLQLLVQETNNRSTWGQLLTYTPTTWGELLTTGVSWGDI